MPVCSFQNGVYGSRLVSTDYTYQENNAMVEASFSLISTKYRLMRNSVERYERIHATYVNFNAEISKRMYTRDFPEEHVPAFRGNLSHLQDAFRVRWAALESDLCAMEEVNRDEISSMYACSTNALSKLLEAGSRLRQNPIVVHTLVRQDAMSLPDQGASTRTCGFKRSRSSSPSNSACCDTNDDSGSGAHHEDGARSIAAADDDDVD